MKSFSSSYEFSSISDESLEKLSKLTYSPKLSRRLCLHDDNDSNLQMMVIDLQPNAFYDFHKHSGSDEIVILLDGKIFYSFESRDNVELELSKKRSLIIKKGQKHSVLAGPEGARFIEIIRGPFKPNQETND